MKGRKVLLFLLVTGLVITGIYSSKNSFLLKTPKAQHGMLSLGSTYDTAKQAAILREWRTDTAYTLGYCKESDTVYRAVPIVGLPTAINQRTADFGFIFFYVALFGFLICINRYSGASVNGDNDGSINKDNYTKPELLTALLVLLAAGIADCLQNVFMLHDMGIINNSRYGRGPTGMAHWVCITFCLKWLFWIFTSVDFYRRVIWPRQEEFLKEVKKIGSGLALQLWRFRIVVIGLLVLYIALTLVDQGEDLLVAIGDSARGTACFAVGIFILALLNWYLPKIYDNIRNLKKLKDKDSGYDNDELNIKKYLGRITGSVTLMVPATGILSVMQTYHVPYLLQPVPAWLIFALVLWFYIELLRHNLLDRVYMAGKEFLIKRYWFTFGLIVAIIVFLGIFRFISPLAFLSITFFLLSFLFLLTVNYRVEFKKDIPFLKIMYIASGVILLLFILVNFPCFLSSLICSNRFFSLPVFIAGIIFYTVLASVLLLFGRRYNWPFITTLLVIGVICSSHAITNFHRVRTSRLAIQPKVKEKSLREYVRDWLVQRRAEIDSQYNKKCNYPVFFVNSYGGGIRAAAWTVMAVGHLNRMMQHDTPDYRFSGDFEHYVFAYSGASGGTIGESLLVGARINNWKLPLTDTDKTNRVMNLFKHDYLTNDLVGILGRDAWMGSFGLDWLQDDRASLTEQAYEKYTKKLGICYDIPFRLGWQDVSKDVPLLVSNTFDVNTSRKGILSPVYLSKDDFPGVVLIQPLLDSLKRDINLSSGAFLSARFPYVSPTGKFDENHHFTDGGSIENAGSETSLQMIRVFNSVLDSLKRNDPVYDGVKICILSLPNEVAAITEVERVKNIYELTAPPLGLLLTINGNAERDEAINEDSVLRYHWNYYRMAPQDARIGEGKIHPILPLGWQISDEALSMMEKTVKRKDNSDLDKIIAMFKTEFKR